MALGLTERQGIQGSTSSCRRGLAQLARGQLKTTCKNINKYEFGFQWPPAQGAKQKPLPGEMFIRGEGKAVTSDPTHSRGWESQVPKVGGLTATLCRNRAVLGGGKPCNSITWQQVQDLTLLGCPAGSQSQNDYNFRKKHRAWSRILLCSQGRNKTPCQGIAEWRNYREAYYRSWAKAPLLPCERRQTHSRGHVELQCRRH